MTMDIPATMKAVVFEKIGQWAVRQVPTPRLTGPTDLLVRVLACGICGTDNQILLDPPGAHATPGVIIGHEMVAEVVAVGDAVDAFQPGDMVVGDNNLPCGHCTMCHGGQYNECASLRSMGEDIDGFMCQYQVMPQSQAIRLPAGTPVDTGGDPQDPPMPSGSATILDGSSDVYIPYVRVKLVGLTPQAPELIISKINYNLSTAGTQLDLHNSMIGSLESKVSGHTKAVSGARTVCGTKVVSVSNSYTFTLFQAVELSSLASSVGGKASVVAAAATNGDWNAVQAKIEATLIQNNALLCYMDKAITGSIRVNYAITFTV